MPDKRYKIGDRTFVEREDGSVEEIKAASSIEDGASAKFGAPKIPYKIPGKAVIENTPAPEVGTYSSASPSIPGSAILPDPRNIKSNLTAAGSMAAGMLAGPAGFFPTVGRSAMGAMLGNAGGQLLEGQRNPNQEFSLGEMAQEGVLDAAISTAFGGLGTIAGKLKPLASSIKKRGFKEALSNAILDSSIFQARNTAGQTLDFYSPADRAALNAAPNVPLTVGMATGKTLPEDVLTPIQKQIAARNAAKENLETLKPFLPGETTDVSATAARKSTIGAKNSLRKVENLAYREVDDIANSFVKEVPNPDYVPPEVDMDAGGLPVFKSRGVGKPTIKVVGPINVGEVKKYAQDNLPQIRETLGQVQGSPTLSAKFKSLEKTLSQFENTDVIGYQTARDIQANINSILRDADNGLLPTNTTRMLTGLKSNLDKDVLASMEMGWPEGSAEAFKRAMSTTKRRSEIITRGINKREMAAQQYPEDFFKGAFNSISRAKEVQRTVGKKRASQEFVRDFTDKFWNKPGESFDGAKALAEWGKTNTSEVAGALLNKEQRQAIEQFFRRAAIIEGNPSNIGVMALASQEITSGLGTVKDAANVLSGNVGSLFSNAGLKLSAIIGSKKFSERVLLNPARARAASRLMGMRRTRPGAESEARNFIVGSKLGEIILRADNGEEVLYDTETGEATKLK